MERSHHPQSRLYRKNCGESILLEPNRTLMRWKLLEIRFAWTVARLQPWYNSEEKILLHRLNSMLRQRNIFLYRSASICRKGWKKGRFFFSPDFPFYQARPHKLSTKFELSSQRNGSNFDIFIIRNWIFLINLIKSDNK